MFLSSYDDRYFITRKKDKRLYFTKPLMESLMLIDHAYIAADVNVYIEILIPFDNYEIPNAYKKVSISRGVGTSTTILPGELFYSPEKYTFFGLRQMSYGIRYKFGIHPENLIIE